MVQSGPTTIDRSYSVPIWSLGGWGETTKLTKKSIAHYLTRLWAKGPANYYYYDHDYYLALLSLLLFNRSAHSAGPNRCISLSLSIHIYIYIYIYVQIGLYHTHLPFSAPRLVLPRPGSDCKC